MLNFCFFDICFSFLFIYYYIYFFGHFRCDSFVYLCPNIVSGYDNAIFSSKQIAFSFLCRLVKWKFLKWVVQNIRTSHSSIDSKVDRPNSTGISFSFFFLINRSIDIYIKDMHYNLPVYIFQPSIFYLWTTGI